MRSRTLAWLTRPGLVVAAIGAFAAWTVTGCGSGGGGGASQQLLYVLERPNNRVAQYVVESDGSVRPLAVATVATGKAPSAAAVEPGHKYVYVVNRDDNTVSQYEVGTNGHLAPLPTATIATGSQPVSIAVHPNGKYVYVANSGDNTISLYQISGRGPGELQVHIEARFVEIQGSGLKEIGIDWTGSYLYGINSTSNNIAQFKITPTGNLTELTPATVPLSGSPTDMAMNPRGPSFYVLTPATDRLEHAIIGPTGGVTLQVSPQVSPGSGAISLSVHPEGRTIDVLNSLQNRVQHYYMNNGVMAPLPSVTTDTVQDPRLIANSLREPGETLVLGGLQLGIHHGAKTSIPGSGDIPIVGQLFHQRTVDADSSELLVFISPHVIKSAD